MARNILVVEDDRNISDLIRMYLDKEGFEVRIAYDGGKAVEEFEKQKPDLVLLDIMLPVLDGWGVCAKIREKAKTPIIMLTAKGDVGDRITGLEMGADGPESTRLSLQAGSFFVMVSDGVADETDDEWLQNLMAGWSGQSAEALASLILSESRTRRGLRDDCAVLVLHLPKMEDSPPRQV